MMKERLVYISYLRVMAMLLIVFYHCFCCYSVWTPGGAYSAYSVPLWQMSATMLANFHLPIFTLVAGYLFSYLSQQGHYDDKRKFLRGKVNRLLLPYVVWGVFLIVLQGRPVSQLLMGVSHLWYLLFLFVCFVLTMAVNVRSLAVTPPRKIIYITALLLFLWAMAGVKFSVPIRWFCISQLSKYLPFFLLGAMLALPVCRNMFSRRGSLAAFILITVISALCIVVRQMDFGGVINHVSVGLSCVTLPLMPLLFFVYMRGCRNLRDSLWLQKLDHWSMGIYIVHHIYIQELNSLSPFHECMMRQPYLYPLLLFVIVLPLSVATVWLMQQLRWGKYLVG